MEFTTLGKGYTAPVWADHPNHGNAEIAHFFAEFSFLAKKPSRKSHLICRWGCSPCPADSFHMPPSFGGRQHEQVCIGTMFIDHFEDLVAIRGVVISRSKGKSFSTLI